MCQVEVVVLVLTRDESGTRSGACSVTQTYGPAVNMPDTDSIAVALAAAADDLLRLTSTGGKKL